jgi:hypothetical protein
MDPLIIEAAIEPEDLLECMLTQYSVEEITTLVMKLPKAIKDKKFIQDIHEFYEKVLDIYKESGK